MNFLTSAGLLVCGGAAGLVGALFGLGGGVFLIPALVLAFGIPMHSAVGIGLVTVIATSSAAASVNVGRGLANIRLGILLEPATVLGALAGGLLAPYVPARTLIGLFSLLLFINAGMLWRGRGRGEDIGDLPPAPTAALRSSYRDAASGRLVVYGVERLPLTMVVAFAAGILSALLGVGGGILKVPALHLLGRVPMKAAAATSNFMIGVTAAASAALYLGRGDIPPFTAGTVVLGVLAGSALGLRLVDRMSDRAVRRQFSLLTLVFGLLMLRRALVG